MVETRQPPASAPNRSGVVFVSHEKSDVGLAREIRGHLESGGFDCWLAADDIRGPVPWPEQIAAAIDDCDVMLVVVSAHANGSPHVSREVDLAVDKGKPLLPVRVEDIAPTGSLDYLLRLAQWIDLFPGPVADHASTLHGMVGSMLTEQGVVAPLQPPPPSPAGPRKRRVWPRVVAAVVLIAAAVGGTFVVLSGELGDDDPSTEVEGATTDVENSSSTEPAEPSAAASGVGRVNMVSVTSGGAQGDGASSNPDISDDGRYVVFDSLATNLVVNDSGAWGDIFVHDRSSGRTSRVSQRLENSRFSQEAVGESHHPRISGDGRFVVFVSEAANLDSGGAIDDNGASDIYLHDVGTNTTTLISRAPDGTQHTLHSIDPSISDDGTLIAYGTYAHTSRPEEDETPSGMYGAWVHDTTTGITVPIGELDPRVVSPPEVSENGDIVAVGGSIGVLVFETESGEVTEPLPDVYPERVLPGAFGHRIYHFSRGSALPPDGEDDLWPLLFHDLRTGDVGTAIEAAPNGPMSISSDGRMMTIEHRMREALVWDTSDGTSQELRAPAAGTIGAVRLSGDGRHAVYSTQSANVVPDENGAPDVFVMQVLE